MRVCASVCAAAAAAAAATDVGVVTRGSAHVSRFHSEKLLMCVEIFLFAFRCNLYK